MKLHFPAHNDMKIGPSDAESNFPLIYMIKTQLYMLQIGTYTQKTEKSKTFCLIKSGPARTGPGPAQTGPDRPGKLKISEI